MWFLTSKCKKYINKWNNDHVKIVLLMQNVCIMYTKNESKTQKNLDKLDKLLKKHLASEDEGIEYFMLKYPSLHEIINNFIRDFSGVRLMIDKFYEEYKNGESTHRDFINLKNKILERVRFEEYHFYRDLLNKQKG